MKYQVVFCFAALFVLGVFAEDEKPVESAPAVSETCVPGEDYVDGCNSCHCPESGKKSEAICTLKACSGQENPEVPTQQVEKCEPGKTFMKDSCNSCTCPADGNRLNAACTAIACPPPTTN